ncbi:hypothetical protein [Rufibacter sp. LB8]|uniref:hypothetical protein n=1 Tax=Rufibacter sp. LB8 TaxID=2777781 RepID=UPI00178C51E5|nr:hypothetical protein [Rufibacter sp. LB8]
MLYDKCKTVDEGLKFLATELCLPVSVIDEESNCHLAMLENVNYSPFFLAKTVHAELGLYCDQYLTGATVYRKVDLPEMVVKIAIRLGAIR